LTWACDWFCGTPILLVCVAALLGAQDGVVLALVWATAVFSSTIGLITEHIRTVLNPCTTTGFSQNVMLPLRFIHDATLCVVAGVVLIPFCVNLVHTDDHFVTNVQVLLVVLLVGLVCTSLVTSFAHHRACARFESFWPGRNSMTAWGVSGWTRPPSPELAQSSFTSQATDNQEHSTENQEHSTTVAFALSPVTSVNYDGFVPVAGVVDDDDQDTRMSIGLRTEWRRYYIVNIFMDALFLVTILSMTIN
jgi:hypothetical protein